MYDLYYIWLDETKCRCQERSSGWDRHIAASFELLYGVITGQDEGFSKRMIMDKFKIEDGYSHINITIRKQIIN